MPSSQSNSYLPWSIFNLLFCCFPLGLVALFYSCQAKNAAELGNMERATATSTTAKKWNIAATVLGIILLITIIAVVVAKSHY